MKIKCNQDHWPASKGLLGFGAKDPEKIDGLTKGKTYDGSPVSYVIGSGNIGLGSVETNFQFLIYNDNDEWQKYQLNLFEPI